MINTGVYRSNPFPGSRPFFPVEDKYFFGREEAVAEILSMLLDSRFVALVGSSASGKTSLIQSGLIPALIAEEKQEWIPVYIRPGARPLESLIRGFQQVFPKKILEADVLSFLDSSQSLSDFILEKGLGSYYYFLVVDQFEELFQGHSANRRKKRNGKNLESRQFIDQLLKLVNVKKPQVYVMLSVRSDYLENCSSHRLLTERINSHKYLLPQMTRDALREAILEPIRQAGATVEPGFDALILDELQEVEPRLPLLQHALMRTWDHWAQKEQADQPVSLVDYKAIGSVRNALANNLEEAYRELSPQQQTICVKLFKSIAFRAESQEVFSRRITVGQVARISQCSVQDIMEVVEVFRKPGRAFISPHHSIKLNSDRRIELSHESLIRIWDRLLRWVEEETESIRMYLSLTEASLLYQQGKAELLTGPELLAAQEWRDIKKPTPAWGIQFDPAFERAMVFLRTSEEEQQLQKERQLSQLKRKRLINRSLIIGGATVIAIVALIFILRSPGEDTDGKQLSPVANYEIPLDDVPGASAVAETAEQTLSGTSQEQTGEDLRSDPDQEVQQEPSSDESSQNQEAQPEESGDSPNQIPQEENPVNPLSELARDLAYQSTGISKNPDLQGLLAYQAYLINMRNGGNPYDAEIYQGLYEATKKLISPAYNIYPSLRHSIKDMKWLNRTGSILVVLGDGTMKILSGRIADRAAQINLAGTGVSNECLVVSPDESLAAVGTSGKGLLFIELENRGQVVHQSDVQGGIILLAANLGQRGGFLTAGTNGEIYRWSYDGFTGAPVAQVNNRITAMASSKDGSIVGVGTRNGIFHLLQPDNAFELLEVNNFGRNHVTALGFSPDNRYIAVGLLDGSVKLLSGNGQRLIRELNGPSTRVSDLEFSPDGQKLAAASHDGRVYLWSMEDPGATSLEFSENNGFVLSICFSANSQHFYSGSVDYPRMVGRPTSVETMAQDFCSLLSRNLTEDEWVQYLGQELPYERSCPDLN